MAVDKVILVFVLLLCWAPLLHAAANATHPTEVELLKTFHRKLVGVGPAIWDFSDGVDPCNSDVSSWRNVKPSDNFELSSGVECNCSGTYCHVTKLVVVSMNVAGQIAPEIGNFSMLENINLAQNMLTGPIPKEIGRLPMKYLSLSKNKLSGTLPSELGNLSMLISFGFGLNNFTGKLPKEIGNMGALEQLYFNNNGFEGEIPAKFSGLTKLKYIEGYNNYLTGSIPDIFTNMTSLEILRLYGNTFQGRIPPSLWKLETLKELVMDRSGISNLSLPSSLASMKALTNVSFRNCGLTGIIPNQIGNLTSLTYLDLSFNNFTGEIPSTFGFLTALRMLFLGSNNLTGEIPMEMSNLRSLQYIDLSYNQLSGSIPSWITRSDLQVNLIWNWFHISKSNRIAATSFNCLDSKSPCTRSTTGKHVKFSINCGGQQLPSYDDDSSALKYVDFKIHSSKHWAVSTVGYNDMYGNNYIASPADTDVDVSNGLDEQYRTARKSPGSLRYFGLNMRNGNYSLELHFAEIEISANRSIWQSTGKRLFDIYIQGENKYENFDIVDVAKGAFKPVIVRHHNVQVTQGVLEVHLKWSGMGTCCIPRSRIFGPLISAIVVSPEFHYSTTPYGRIIGIVISIIVALILMCLLTFLCWRRRQQIMLAKQELEQDFKSIENKPDIFTYNELKIATKGFQQQNMLGEGGFGTVYKGVLPDGTIVAVKKLSQSKPNQKALVSKSTRQEFINEICAISAVKHRNLVKLLGCCIEGDHRILVLEFLENNSLQQALLGPLEVRLDIGWSIRYNICVEVARGIAYLHEESLPRIIHRDIKASNILLDKNLQPKIADFGLAKLFGDDKTHISTKVAGTLGYLSPEYATRGQLTEKLDVYSYGVLALEIISGRKNLDLSLPEDEIYLLEWVMQLNKNNSLLQVIDPRLGNKYSEEEAMAIIEVAILCTQASPNKRPTMSNVVDMLIGCNKSMLSSNQHEKKV